MQIDIVAGLKRLDELAREEYGTDFAGATNIRSEEKRVRRIARLSGIELKFPFATAHNLTGPSETGAHREWNFKQELLIPDASGKLPLDKLKGNPSYDLEKVIYEELRSRSDDPARNISFGSFLADCHSESNWFLALLRAAQPYLCGESHQLPVEESAKRRQFWELLAAAGEDLTKKGVEVAAESLCALVPWLAGAPAAVAAGLTIFLFHYVKKGYCKAKIQKEIIETLKWRNNEWEKK